MVGTTNNWGPFSNHKKTCDTIDVVTTYTVSFTALYLLERGWNLLKENSKQNRRDDERNRRPKRFPKKNPWGDWEPVFDLHEEDGRIHHILGLRLGPHRLLQTTKGHEIHWQATHTLTYIHKPESHTLRYTHPGKHWGVAFEHGPERQHLQLEIRW